MTSSPDWHLVLPIKGGSSAKSRLHVPGVNRADLAAALALDVLDAVAAADLASVCVVTSDPWMAAAAADHDVAVLPDPGLGLNAAARVGLAAAPARNARGVLLADVPALTASTLREALATCSQYPRAFVPDRHGWGTVLLTAAPRVPAPIHFGPDSAIAHANVGYERLDLELPGLRTDVDTAADWRVAALIGLGAHTRVFAGSPALQPGAAGPAG
ncbi:MAG: 2-phospho-L-lactate guanylyltransferase [Nostocoides sp.]